MYRRYRLLRASYPPVRKIGVMEYWSIGVLGLDPSLHHSITPSLQFVSSAPVVGQILAQPLVPGFVDPANRAHLRIAVIDALHQRDDSQVDSGQMRIGAEIVADHHDSFGLQLR